jgi:rare lipoprotein A (peptidoglycan hydrolase)
MIIAGLDLSYAAFAHIESTRKGNANICYRVIG